MEILIPISFFVVVAFIIQMIINYKLRNKLLEKGANTENIEAIIQTNVDSSFSSLRWGLVTTAIGLAFFISQILPVLDNDKSTMGLLFLLGGLALIISYMLEKK